jgi:hypothetical protein
MCCGRRSAQGLKRIALWQRAEPIDGLAQRIDNAAKPTAMRRHACDRRLNPHALAGPHGIEWFEGHRAGMARLEPHNLTRNIAMAGFDHETSVQHHAIHRSSNGRKHRRKRNDTPPARGTVNA